MQSINAVLGGSSRILRRAQTSTLMMKTKLVLLPLVLASLCLSSCASAGLEFRNSFSGRVTPGERVAAGAFDLVTLPVQLPVIAAMKISE
jgi:hypothetical protein